MKDAGRGVPLSVAVTMADLVLAMARADAALAATHVVQKSRTAPSSVENAFEEVFTFAREEEAVWRGEEKMRWRRMKREEKKARPAQPVTRTSPGTSSRWVSMFTTVPGIGTLLFTNALFWSVLSLC